MAHSESGFVVYAALAANLIIAAAKFAAALLIVAISSPASRIGPGAGPQDKPT